MIQIFGPCIFQMYLVEQAQKSMYESMYSIIKKRDFLIYP